MNSSELVIAISTLASAIACQLTVDEVSLLGVIFTQLGDTLLTISTKRELCDKKGNT